MASDLNVENKLVSQAQRASEKLQNKALAALGQRAGLNGSNALSEVAKRIQKGGLKAVMKEQVKNLADAKLAETIFKTGPKDELLTVDVFGISDNSILNNLSNKLSSYAVSALEAFRKSTGLSTDLTKLFKKTDKGFSIDASALTDRVTKVLSGSSSLLRGLSDSLQSQLTQGVNGMAQQIYNQVRVKVGDVARDLNLDGSISDARGILELVNHITGDSRLSKFIDIGAEANMLSGIFREAIEMGIPEAVEALAEAAQDSPSADYALRGNIEVAVTMSDLDTTALMVDKLGINRVLADVPDAAQRLVSNYRLPPGTSNSELDAVYTKLSGVLDQLQPNWRSYDRNGQPVSDLSLFYNASPDARRLFARQPALQVEALIAAEYTPKSMLEQARAMYPKAVIR